MRAELVFLSTLLAACAGGTSAGPSGADGSLNGATPPPPASEMATTGSPTGGGPSDGGSPGQLPAGGMDCAGLVAAIGTLVGQLRADPGSAPQPPASEHSKEVLGALSAPPDEAGEGHLSLYQGLMITCEPAQGLVQGISDASSRWKTIGEDLPAALESCGCMANREAVLEWVWVTGQHWPPEP
jgi:hypothetical protein